MEKVIDKTFNWWYCDNIVHPKMEGVIGLLHLGEPNVFVLFRDLADIEFSDYESWKEGVAEVQFIYPEERKKFDVDEILLDAWNFSVLQTEKDEEGMIDLMNEME